MGLPYKGHVVEAVSAVAAATAGTVSIDYQSILSKAAKRAAGGGASVSSEGIRWYQNCNFSPFYRGLWRVSLRFSPSCGFGIKATGSARRNNPHINAGLS